MSQKRKIKILLTPDEVCMITDILWLEWDRLTTERLKQGYKKPWEEEEKVGKLTYVFYKLCEKYKNKKSKITKKKVEEIKNNKKL